MAPATVSARRGSGVGVTMTICASSLVSMTTGVGVASARGVGVKVGRSPRIVPGSGAAALAAITTGAGASLASANVCDQSSQPPLTSTAAATPPRIRFFTGSECLRFGRLGHDHLRGAALVC